MASGTWTRSTLPDESVPSTLDSTPWVNINFDGPRLHSPGVRPQVQKNGQAPPNYRPPNYVRSSPDPRQARRFEISSSYQNSVYAPSYYASPSSPPQYPTPPPRQLNAYPIIYSTNSDRTYTPTPSGSTPRSSSTGSAIGWRPYNDQSAWYSNQHTNSTQSGYRYLPASSATEQPMNRRAAKQKAAAGETRARQQQQGFQTESIDRWRAQVYRPPGQSENGSRREERALRAEPQVLEPGRSSSALSSVRDWDLDSFDVVQSRSRSQTSTSATSTSRDPQQSYRTPSYETGSTSFQEVPRYIPPLTSSSYSSDDDSNDDTIAPSEEWALLPQPLIFHQAPHMSFLTAQGDRNHTQKNASLPALSPCLICTDVPKMFPELPPTANCTHTSTICASCLEQYISEAVLSRGLTTLTCPELECRKTMEYADIVRSAKNNQACLNRYEALLLQRTLERDPNFVRCKNPRCGSGQLHEGGAAAPIVVCQTCQARSCFTHDIPWHSGLTCEEYTARRAERAAQDQASQAYLDRNAKVCPNPSCGRRIEKSDGCDHMTCRRPAGCGHEFCWVCLADYGAIIRGGNHRHDPTCRYYAAVRLPPAIRPPPTIWREILLPPATPPPLAIPPPPAFPPPSAIRPPALIQERERLHDKYRTRWPGPDDYDHIRHQDNDYYDPHCEHCLANRV